jgi:hypothetical protein
MWALLVKLYNKLFTKAEKVVPIDHKIPIDHKKIAALEKVGSYARNHFKRKAQKLEVQRLQVGGDDDRQKLLVDVQLTRKKWMSKLTLANADSRENLYAVIDQALMIKNPDSCHGQAEGIVEFNRRIIQNKENPYLLVMQGERVAERVKKLHWLNEYGVHNPSSTLFGLAIVRKADHYTVIHRAVELCIADKTNPQYFEVLKALLQIDISINNQERDSLRQTSPANLEVLINIINTHNDKTAFDLVIESGSRDLLAMFVQHNMARERFASAHREYNVPALKCAARNNVILQENDINRRASWVEKIAAPNGVIAYAPVNKKLDVVVRADLLEPRHRRDSFVSISPSTSVLGSPRSGGDMVQSPISMPKLFSDFPLLSADILSDLRKRKSSSSSIFEPSNEYELWSRERSVSGAAQPQGNLAHSPAQFYKPCESKACVVMSPQVYGRQKYLTIPGVVHVSAKASESKGMGL